MNVKLLAAVVAAIGTVAASAADASSEERVSARQAWARETAPAQTSGGGFVTLVNRGTLDDRLVSATTPVAGEVQFHTMNLAGGIMLMRQVRGGVSLPAGKTVTLRPGALHLMLLRLKHPLRQGERFPMTFQFQRAGRITVQFAVQPIDSTEALGGARNGR